MSMDKKSEEVAGNTKRSYDESNGFEGGYMNAKIRKLEQQNILFKENIGLSVDDSEICDDMCNLFRGVSIHINGLTDPPCDDLRKLILTYGGEFDFYYTSSKTTHIIASNLAYCKTAKLSNKKVVKPSWITDSIRERRLLPYTDYLIYPIDKRIIDFGDKPSSLSSSSNKIKDCLNTAADLKNPNDCEASTSTVAFSAALNVEVTESVANISSESHISEVNSKESFASLPISFSMIDKETLDALPKYMRDEICLKYNISSQSSESKKLSGKVKKLSNIKSKEISKKEGPLDKMFKDIKAGKQHINTIRVSLDRLVEISKKAHIDSLIREWVFTHQEVSDADCAFLTNYLTNLVSGKYFSLLTIIMQCLYENISERNDPVWKEMFNDILKSLIDDADDSDRANVPVFQMIPF